MKFWRTPIWEPSPGNPQDNAAQSNRMPGWLDGRPVGQFRALDNQRDTASLGGVGRLRTGGRAEPAFQLSHRLPRSYDRGRIPVQLDEHGEERRGR